MRPTYLLLVISLALFAGCGDSMSRGLVITGDGKVGANNARNQRENTQDALRDALLEDLGDGWQAQVQVRELPVWIEDRVIDSGSWRWERITASIILTPPAGTALDQARHDSLDQDVRRYLMGKLAKRDASLVELGITVAAASGVAASALPVPQAAGQRTYVVQPGDTLADISLAFYGSAQYWRRIADANPGGTEAGKTIVIPAAAAQAAPAPAAP